MGFGDLLKGLKEKRNKEKYIDSVRKEERDKQRLKEAKKFGHWEAQQEFKEKRKPKKNAFATMDSNMGAFSEGLIGKPTKATRRKKGGDMFGWV